jgi:hypothetical protein
MMTLTMKQSNSNRGLVRSVAQLIAGVLTALALPLPDASAAPCVVPLHGKWQQTHTLIQGNKISDDTQSWVFKPDGSMVFAKTKPALNVPGKYVCDGYVIQLMGRIGNSYKIVDHGIDTMTWESNLGGTVFVKQVAK